MSDDQLSQVRTRIDDIDQQIYHLLKERAQLAIDVARLKELNYNHPAYYRPEREAQILRKIMDNNDSLLSDRGLAQIFRDIMTACLALQKQLTIAYLGPAGTFSQMAAEAHFGKAATTLAVENIPRIFREVEADNAHYGVVPIENTTEGTVNLTLDAFLNSTLYICGEIELPIHQHLLSNADDLQSIIKVYGHQQSLAQCRNWLAEHLSHATTVEVNSNGAAAQLASQEANTAALGPHIAAEIYALQIIKHNIEDQNLNSTRFIILGKQQIPPSGKDKTSLLISTPHSPGSLYSLLQPFANNNVNMTLIESRPYRHRNWSYLFFMDIEGHQQDAPVKNALAELAQMSIMMTILGSYPRAVL